MVLYQQPHHYHYHQHLGSPPWIGNQTACAASDPLDPLAFALEQGFTAFEWFADPKTDPQGNPYGWDMHGMTGEQRSYLSKLGESAGINYTVHAPAWANPCEAEGCRWIEASVDFARDIGATLVNLHVFPRIDQGVFAHALQRLADYAAARGIQLSLENMPQTTPADSNSLFQRLATLDLVPNQVGMCLDLGHANLCPHTRNDYLRYLGELAPEVPIIHLHIHENYGDWDSHLTLFTGPAGENDAGIRALVEQLWQRGYHGAMILEQWPQPPLPLVEAHRRLRQLCNATWNRMPRG